MSSAAFGRKTMAHQIIKIIKMFLNNFKNYSKSKTFRYVIRTKFDFFLKWEDAFRNKPMQ